ncbi:hypothetical protein Mapa_017402 [Marchantia paleacea]|nr:hypothetical protein Mapa_017402 [Marchantia paleacea]
MLTICSCIETCSEANYCISGSLCCGKYIVFLPKRRGIEIQNQAGDIRSSLLDRGSFWVQYVSCLALHFEPSSTQADLLHSAIQENQEILRKFEPTSSQAQRLRQYKRMHCVV